METSNIVFDVQTGGNRMEKIFLACIGIIISRLSVEAELVIMAGYMPEFLTVIQLSTGCHFNQDGVSQIKEYGRFVHGVQQWVFC